MGTLVVAILLPLTILCLYPRCQLRVFTIHLCEDNFYNPWNWTKSLIWPALHHICIPPEFFSTTLWKVYRSGPLGKLFLKKPRIVVDALCLRDKKLCCNNQYATILFYLDTRPINKRVGHEDNVVVKWKCYNTSSDLSHAAFNKSFLDYLPHSSQGVIDYIFFGNLYLQSINFHVHVRLHTTRSCRWQTKL